MASLPPPPPDSNCGCNSTSNSQKTHTSLPRLFRAAFTYDTNIMLAAIISLLLVILFILLLHLYTRWYLAQVRRRSRSRVIVPRVLGSRLHNRFAVDTSPNYSGYSIIKRGLPISAIASLPQFVYKFSSDEDHDQLDCAICLSAFEEEEVGRKLPGCGHAFHVECIDMWLHSHSTCPICRAAIQCNHSRKIDHLEIEIADPEQEAESDGVTIENDEQLPSESVTTTSEEITEEAAADAAENDCTVGGAPSSSIGESLKKFLTSSGSCSSRSGGKIHPSSNDNGDEPEAC